jgi:hypothetical protein
MVVVDYSISDDEFDMEDKEEIALVLLMNKNKKPKHGGSVFSCEYIQKMKIDADHKLMANYFLRPSVSREVFLQLVPNVH